MPIVKPVQFYDALKKGDFGKVYLIAGEENLLIKEALKSIEKAVNAGNLNREIFYGAETCADEVSMAMQTMPFLSERRLVIVKDADRLRASEREKLAEFIKISSQSSCLVIVWPEKIRPENQKSSLFEAVKESGIIVEFRRPYDNELPSWIQKEAEKRSKRITIGAVQCLIQESGSNLMDLRNEIEKLGLFTGANKEITLEDVELSSGRTKTANLNSLAEAVESKQIDTGLKIVEDLLSEGEIPLKILSALYRVIRRLFYAKSLLEENKSSCQEIKQELRLHQYFDRNFFANLSRFSLEDLRGHIDAVLHADMELKTSSRTEALVFEELLLTLCGNGIVYY